MDHIDEYKTTASQDLNYSAAIRAALALGKRTLNRYYDKTDHSEIYRIAMGMLSGWFLPIVILNILYSVLHPCHKLNYFKKAGWDDTWIKTTQEIVCTKFDQTYAFMDVEAGASCKATCKTISCVHYIWDERTNSFFQPSTGWPRTCNWCPCLVAWEKSCLSSSSSYGYRLFDYSRSVFLIVGFIWLMIRWSATSIDVEHTFSQGQLLLSHVRSCLSIQSTRALMCLGTWGLLGYVNDTDVKAITILPELRAGEKKGQLLLDWDEI